MEIGNTQIPITNYEVYKFLGDLVSGDKQSGKKKIALTQTHLANVAHDTIRYLEGSPCRTQNQSSIQAFVSSLDRFKLHKSEKLQLINLRPTTVLEVQLIIKDCEERLDEDELYDIVRIIQEHLPDPSQEVMNGAP